jgi:hypothetical protein
MYTSVLLWEMWNWGNLEYSNTDLGEGLWREYRVPDTRHYLFNPHFFAF